jgi:hypothetical protein
MSESDEFADRPLWQRAIALVMMAPLIAILDPGIGLLAACIALLVAGLVAYPTQTMAEINNAYIEFTSWVPPEIKLVDLVPLAKGIVFFAVFTVVLCLLTTLYVFYRVDEEGENVL